MNTPSAKKFLNVELKDDNTPMDEVNYALIDCGIKPINYDGYVPTFYTREEVFAELESREYLDPTLDWELCYEYVADRGRKKPLADIVDEWENLPNN